MRPLLFAGAATLVLCQAVSAQIPTTPPVSNNGMAQNQPNNLRSDLRDMLQHGGYSDIRVMPSSFVIRRKTRMATR
jgi:hypothetical protein